MTRNISFSTSTGPGPGKRLIEHIEVGPHGGDRVFVGKPEHLVDDPVVRDAEADGEAPLADGLDRQDCWARAIGMPRLHRHHRRPDLDSCRPGARRRWRR